MSSSTPCTPGRSDAPKREAASSTPPCLARDAFLRVPLPRTPERGTTTAREGFRSEIWFRHVPFYPRRQLSLYIHLPITPYLSAVRGNVPGRADSVCVRGQGGFSRSPRQQNDSGMGGGWTQLVSCRFHILSSRDSRFQILAGTRTFWKTRESRPASPALARLSWPLRHCIRKSMLIFSKNSSPSSAFLAQPLTAFRDVSRFLLVWWL